MNETMEQIEVRKLQKDQQGPCIYQEKAVPLHRISNSGSRKAKIE